MKNQQTYIYFFENERNYSWHQSGVKEELLIHFANVAKNKIWISDKLSSGKNTLIHYYNFKLKIFKYIIFIHCKV